MVQSTRNPGRDPLEAREAGAVRPYVADAEQDPAGGTSKGAVLEVLRAMMARASVPPQRMRLFAVLQAESIDPDHPAHAWGWTRDKTVREFLTRLVTPHVEDSQSTARLLVAQMDGLAQHWLREGQSFDLQEEWDRALAKHLPAFEAAGSGTSTKPGRTKSQTHQFGN